MCQAWTPHAPPPPGKGKGSPLPPLWVWVGHPLLHLGAPHGRGRVSATHACTATQGGYHGRGERGPATYIQPPMQGGCGMGGGGLHPYDLEPYMSPPPFPPPSSRACIWGHRPLLRTTPKRSVGKRRSPPSTHKNTLQTQFWATPDMHTAPTNPPDMPTHVCVCLCMHVSSWFRCVFELFAFVFRNSRFRTRVDQWLPIVSIGMTLSTSMPKKIAVRHRDRQRQVLALSYSLRLLHVNQ